MELNSTIWGDDSNKIPIYANTNFFNSSKTGASSLGEYRTEYGMTNPVDETVNYWQLADFSMFNSVVYCRRDGNNTPVKTVCRSIMPRSIFLVSSAPTAANMTFNPAQGQNIIWSDIVTGTSAYSGTNYKIGAWFDYNDIVAIFRLVCQKIVDNVPTGSNVTLSIYDYYHESDSNDLKYSENYIIKSIGVGFAVRATNSNIIQTQNNLQFVSSTPVNTPQPNFYWNENSYISYTQHHATGIYDMGSNSNSGAGGYGTQQGAYGQSNNALLFGYDPDSWEIRSYQSGTSTYEYFVCTCTYDEMLRHAASLGFWFNETWATQTSMTFDTGVNCVDDNVIMPEIIGGRTTGNFKRGRQAGADPQAIWADNWRDNAGYSGDKPYKTDQNDSGDLTSVFNRPNIYGSCTYYNFVETELRQLVNAINSGYQPQNNDQFVLEFKGVNPAEYISTCMYYPDGFTCANVPNQSAIPVKIGALELNVTAAQADISLANIVSFSTINIPVTFGDFRDYSPYTSLDLYIPFCGSVELDPAVFIGHTLQVYLFIDFPTGNCTGVVMRDSMVYDTVNGTCGVSIPLTAQNVGQYQNTIKSAEIALKNAEMQRKTAWLAAAGSGVSLIAGVATGNPLAIAGGIGGLAGSAVNVERANLSVESAEYNLSHTAPSVRSLSTASPANALQMDYDCHLIIKRATMSDGYDETIYSHTIGNACAINDVLSTFHGLTVCADADLSGIPCTADEKQQIMQMLKSGVYI